MAGAGLLGGETSITATGKTPAVASNGTTFLVVWSDGADVYGERFDKDGTALAAAFTISNATGAQTEPQVASNGTDYFVVWADARSDAGDIYGVTVSAAGTVGTDTAINTGAATQDDPHLASDGTNYLVAWESTSGDHFDIDASLVVGGVPSGTFAVRATAWEETPAVGSLGGNYLVAWSEYRDHVQGDLYGQLLTGAASMTGVSFLIDANTNHQGIPAIASNGTNYVVAWEDTRNNDFDIYATHVAADSTVTDPTGTVITGYTGEQRFPAIASNGIDYILAWEDDRATQDVYGNLLAGTNVSMTNGFAVASSQAVEESPAIAYNAAGQSYLIAYQSGAGIYMRVAKQCGDGVQEAGEICDDGNAASGDGCSATCAIESGFTCAGTPSVCADIDECLTANGGCQQVCTNTVGSYACGCDSGYSLQQDNVSCADIDECATSNGGCGQTCTNSIGSYTCTCSAGYTLDADAHACDDNNECLVANGGCAQVCDNTPGSFTCACDPGYTLDGSACDDIDECSTANGGCSETCTNTPGSFTCSCDASEGLAADGMTCMACPAGFVGDGTLCTELSSSGCGCQSTDPRQGVVLMLLVLFGLRANRRPRRIAE